MHVHFLDPYRPRRSPVHRLDARVKLLLVVAFILSCALTPDGAWPAYILLLALALEGALLCELGIGFVLKRAALALPFSPSCGSSSTSSSSGSAPASSHSCSRSESCAGSIF